MTVFRRIAVLLAPAPHERPLAMEERAARANLYPPPTQISVSPVDPPLIVDAAFPLAPCPARSVAPDTGPRCTSGAPGNPSTQEAT